MEVLCGAVCRMGSPTEKRPGGTFFAPPAHFFEKILSSAEADRGFAP